MDVNGNNFETISKFDRAVGGLLAGNNIHTKPTTIEWVNKVTGEAETFIVQTIRDEEGDHIVVKFVDKEGVKRLILPPRVTNTVAQQHDALSARARSNSSKATARERMLQGHDPAKALREWRRKKATA